MHSKAKSTSKSNKKMNLLKDHKSNSANSTTQLTLLPNYLMTKTCHTNQKATAHSKYKRKDIIKKMQKEVKEV